MIRCGRCGRLHPEGTDFCDCGAYLEFEGEVVEEEQPPGTDVGPEPESEPESGSEPADEEDANGPRAATGSQVESGQPGPVPPGVPKEPQPPPHRPTTPQRPARPGELICVVCETGNDPENNFCRRCGDDLSQAEPVPEPRPGLWERIRARFRREHEPYQAGERPMRERRGGGGADVAAKGRAGWRRMLGAWVTLMKWLLVLGLVAGAVGLAISPLRQQATSWIGERVDQLRSVVAPEFQPVNAVGARASSEAARHPAAHAVDLLNNTWWATRPGQGQGAQLFVDFGGPVDIAKVGFLNGASGEEEFVAQPRPREVHLVFSNGATADMTLEDSTEFQAFDVEGATAVNGVEVQILSVYPGQGGEQMSLSEIEFRTRR